MRRVLSTLLALSALAYLVAAQEAEQLASNEPNDALPWDRMDVTWLKFSTVPLTASAAVSSGWVLSGACGAGGSWFGNRYLLNNDLSTAPLYDNAGNLVGFQFGIYDTPNTTYINYGWQQQTAFSPNGQAYWTVTTYFVDPNSICSDRPATEGRPVMRKVAAGVGAIGDRVWLQLANGQYMVFPLFENDANPAGWVTGKCFWTMGKHYWYKINSTMTCDQLFPVFLIYNKGVLTTYGAITGVGSAQTQSSSRWEHPGGDVLHKFLPDGGAPDCIFKVGDLSTQHVFLTNPLFDYC